MVQDMYVMQCMQAERGGGSVGAAIGASGAAAVVTGGAAIPSTLGFSAAGANHLKGVRDRIKKEGVDMNKW